MVGFEAIPLAIVSVVLGTWLVARRALVARLVGEINLRDSGRRISQGSGVVIAVGIALLAVGVVLSILICVRVFGSRSW